MDLDGIFEQWEQDSKIDILELSHSAADVAVLHHKYHKLLSRERLILRKMEADLKVLKLEKSEFYIDGPTQEQVERGWKLPPRGRVLKTEAANYVEADEDVIKQTLRLAYQKEKVEVLESIIRSIMHRGFQIKSAIDYEKFKVGAM